MQIRRNNARHKSNLWMKKMTIYGNNLIDIIIIRNYTKYQKAYKPENY